MTWDKTKPLINTDLKDSHPELLANFAALETAIGISGGVLEPTVPKSLFDANTILYATTDNTPAALTVSTSRIVGRASTGAIAALTAAQVLTLINVEAGATADQTEAEILTLLGLTAVEVDQVGAIGTTTISATQWGYLGACTAGGGQLLAALTAGESTQLEKIGTTTISAAQWGYLGACGAGGGQLLAALTAGESDQLELIGTTTISAAQWGYLGGASGIDHYVDRGDPAAYDFTLGSFTTDGTWRDLDLSAIVPAGATTVHVKVIIQDDAAASNFELRKNGNSNTFNTSGMATQVANTQMTAEFTVSCDVDRIIEYRATNLTWVGGIYFVVRGWGLP